MANYDALRQSDLVFAFGTLGMMQQLGAVRLPNAGQGGPS